MTKLTIDYESGLATVFFTDNTPTIVAERKTFKTSQDIEFERWVLNLNYDEHNILLALKSLIKYDELEEIERD